MTATATGTRKLFSKPKYFEQTGYQPHEGQWRAHNTNTRHLVIPCGRRWGKTLYGGKEIEPCCFVTNRYGEPQQGWIVGPQYSDAEKEFRVIYNTFRKLDIHMLSKTFKNNADSGDMHIATNWGFDLQCRSAKHPETLTGEGLDFVLMVEAGRHKRRTWADYIRPALSDRRGWSRHTGVPEGSSRNSLLFALSQKGKSTQHKDRNWATIHMPSWTNSVIFPGGRNDPEILEAEADLTADEFDRQYGAQFVEKSGVVMAEWDDDEHFVDVDYDPQWPVYGAIDYGYTNPFVFLWIQVDVFNNVNVIGEHYIRYTDTEEIARRTLLGHPLAKKLVRLYPDPAEPDDTDILQRILRVPADTNTGGPIRTRLALMRKALETNPKDIVRPQLRVSRKCPQLRWEMAEGYRWPEHQSEIKNDSENPLDKDNHGPEALGRFFRGYYDIVEEDEGGARVHKVKVRR